MKNFIPIFLVLAALALIFHSRKSGVIHCYALVRTRIWNLSSQLITLPRYESISRIIGYVLIGISLLVLGLKALELQSHEAKVFPELLSPVKLSEEGSKAFQRIEKDVLNEVDLCTKNNNCKNKQEETNSHLTIFLADLLSQNQYNSEIQRGLQANQFIGSPSASRGFYFHHYSTILYSYRELKSGNWLSALTNQYGLISIIPVTFLEGKPFNYYSLNSVLILMLIVICASIWIRESTHLIIFSLLILLIALTLNVGQMRLAPGFAIYRLLPTLFITVFLYKNNLKELNWIASIGLIVLLIINSLQFNILIYLIYITSFVVFEAKKIRNLILSQPSIIFVLIIFAQALLYYYNNYDLGISLFSSIEPGRRAIGYGFILMLFPTLLLLSRLRYTWQETFAFAAYTFLASYTISFIGSPQHYSNFIILSLPFICILISSAQIPLLAKFFMPFIFFGIALNMGYLSKPFKIDKSVYVSNYYEYIPIGKELKFELPNQIDKLNIELKSLLNKYQVKDFYFLSKDKIYIEMFNGENLLPSNYDIFANLYSVKSENLIKLMQNKKIDFLIIDSPLQQRITRTYIESASSSLEKKPYLELLKRNEELTKDFEPYLLSCSQRYCLYQIR